MNGRWGDTPELMRVFQEEATERLASLDEGLLHLERDPGDVETLERIRRDAHSIKGSAKLLGFDVVNAVAHRMEDLLLALSNGSIEFASEAMDALLIGCDTLRGLVVEPDTPEDASSAIALLESRLVSARPQEEVAASSLVTEVPAPSPPSASVAPMPESLPDAPADSPVVPGAASATVPQMSVIDLAAPPPPRYPAVEEVASPPTTDPCPPEPPSSPPTPPSRPRAPEPQPATPDLTLLQVAAPVSVPEEPEVSQVLPIPRPPVAPRPPDPAVSPARTHVVDGVGDAPSSARKHERKTLPEAPDKRDGRGYVRLDVNKVFEIVDAVGEAVVGHSGIEERAAHLGALARNLDLVARRVAADSVQPEELVGLFKSLREEFTRLATDMTEAVDESRKRMELVQAAGSRLAMLPTDQLFAPLPRLVRDLSRQLGKDVDLRIEDADAELDKQVMERIAESVRALIINAVDHGIETPPERAARGKPSRARVVLRARQQGGQVAIEVEDDGRGIDPARVQEKALAAGLAEPDEPLDRADMVRLLFSSGFSTAAKVTEVSGRGVGLDIVRDAVDSLRGEIEVESQVGIGTRFILTLPTTMAIIEAILVRVGDSVFCMPVTAVDEVLGVTPDSIRTVAGRSAIVVREHILTLASLGQVLGVASDSDLASAGSFAFVEDPSAPETVPVVVLSHSGRSAAFSIDALTGRREIMLKDVGSFLGSVLHVAGATILGDGSVVPVLDPASLLQEVRRTEKAVGKPAGPDVQPGRKRVLVADDSRPIREMLKSILEGAGFEVATAVDGADAIALLQVSGFDGVVTDVEMPHMTGLDVCRRIRAQNAGLPVVMLTSRDTEEQKREGMEAGANAYLTKNEFDQATFVGLIRTLVG